MNKYARFSHTNVQHRLVPGTKTTVCGRDATLAHCYPALTVKNSTDRRAYRPCNKCSEKG
jgi:hypothetical protein